MTPTPSELAVSRPLPQCPPAQFQMTETDERPDWVAALPLACLLLMAVIVVASYFQAG